MSTTPTRRAVTVATGITAVTASLGGTLVALAGPADAAVLRAPALNQQDCQGISKKTLATYTAVQVAGYKKSKSYLKLAAKTAATYKVYKKNKKNVKAKRAYAAATAAQAAALKANTRLATYLLVSGGPVQPTAVTASLRTGNWTWGTYTTRLLFKGTVSKKGTLGYKVAGVCSYVDETNAGNDETPRVVATDEDKVTSRDTYQGLNKPMSLDVPGTLPILYYATTAAVPTTAAITAAVTKCSTDSYTVVSVACPKGGLVVDMSGATGSSYTVQGYQQSLQLALTAAKSAKIIG
jgi:hypothetical protein